MGENYRKMANENEICMWEINIPELKQRPQMILTD
jgi:hypothetical protein